MLSRRALTITSGTALAVCVVSAAYAAWLPAPDVTTEDPSINSFSGALLVMVLIFGPAFIVFLVSGCLGLMKYLQYTRDRKHPIKEDKDGELL